MAGFGRGRDFAAWLGLVPRQSISGGRTILGSITKSGSRYLRMLFMQAKQAIMMRPKNWHKFSLGEWLEVAATRMPPQNQGLHCQRRLCRPTAPARLRTCGYGTRHSAQQLSRLGAVCSFLSLRRCQPYRTFLSRGAAVGIVDQPLCLRFRSVPSGHGNGPMALPLAPLPHFSRKGGRATKRGRR
ncbi:IS110 family transposase [Rhodobacteraceae bacterium B1Z28]|uniref:IS110 family transposase n=1 Tax=Ruegeria haliotis TaxID=2747601 RepID=A0ABX2PXF9_9RHOB|nr:IS110 family transposase [Ruegeria haliotis]